MGAQAQSTDPLRTCTAAEVRATERYWFMGSKIGIDFGVSGTASSITANPTAPNVLEGSTVVTNIQGDLQFWVGSNTVFNRNQAVMSNGGGLIGNDSAVQVVSAFAATGAPGKYFVVTTTGSTPATPGDLYYSVIDMSADGGLGAVTAKNVLIPGSTGLASEALAAVPTSDGLGHWVLTTQYNSSNLVAVRFDDNGPVGAPVTTALSRPISSAFSTIHFNQQLNRMVLLSGSTIANGNYAFLMQFNAATGVATELAVWLVPVAGVADPNVGASGTRRGYAADFSPSGDYVYVSQIYPGRLWRYNVTTETSAAIIASEEFVGQTGEIDSGNTGIGGGHVLRGPDGAMWIANMAIANLTRIPNPDAATVAGVGFVRGNVALPAGTLSRWGLPQTVAGCPAPFRDLVTGITGPGTLTRGTPGTYTVTVTNQGNLPSSNGTVTITVPGGVTVDPASLPAWCSVAGATITCDLTSVSPIAPGDSRSIPFTITASQDVTNAVIDATVSGVTDEDIVTNNPSSFRINPAAMVTTPVPTLAEWSLIALALLLGGAAAGMRRGRQK